MSKKIPLTRIKYQELHNALKRGPIIYPIWGTPALISRTPPTATTHLTICRLLDDPARAKQIPGINPLLQQKLQKLLATPTAILTGNTGYLVPDHPLTRELQNETAPALWAGIPEPDTETQDLINTTGNDVTLVIIDNPGPGPATIDLTTSPPTLLRKGATPILLLEHILQTNLRLGTEIIFYILVVCTGNSCRSPLGAALLARATSGMPVTIGSAGIAAPQGRPATQPAIAIAREMGLDITAHRARQLTSDMINAADLILVMEHKHREWITQQVPAAEPKIRLLGKNGEIPDPIGRSIDFYRQTANLLKAGVMQVAEEVKKRFQ